MFTKENSNFRKKFDPLKTLIPNYVTHDKINRFLGYIIVEIDTKFKILINSCDFE